MSQLDSDNDSPQEDFAATGAATVDAASDSGSSSSSGEDSDDEGRGKAPKAKRRKVREEREEGLDEGEIEALKQDAGDLVEGKRRRGARKRPTPPPQLPKPDAAASDAAWDAFQAAEAAASASSAGPSKPTSEEMIKVPRRFRFAGDDVVKEEILPVSHPEAIAFLASQKGGVPATGTSSPASGAASPAPTATSSALAAKPRPPPGPRRKKGGGLAALSAAVSSEGKAAKLTTLEKSKMDWDRFKGGAPTSSAGTNIVPAGVAALGPGAGVGLSEAERDEMEAQTKGGASGLGNVKGYMERREFLERVEARLEEGPAPPPLGKRRG